MPHANGRPARVLIVAESEAYLRAMRSLLESEAGFEVVTVLGSDTALAQLASIRPHVVVVKLRMSGMGGLELARRIKARAEAPLVVVLASSDEEAYRSAARAHGADGLVCKFDVDRMLVPAIRQLLDGRRV